MSELDEHHQKSLKPYSLFVRLPKRYSKNKQQAYYPVIHLLDGNAYFDVVASSVDSYIKNKKLSVDPIIVGIGYENAYVMDSLRNRDYTYPEALPADGFKISGKGDKFYDFIKAKLVPHIDSIYRTDKTNRTIMGHSFGGYFVLYTLTRHLKDAAIFNNFVTASPSIYYHDYYLLKEIGNTPFKRNIEDIKVYLTIGERELPEYPSDNFKRMSEIPIDNAIDVQSEVYKNQGHMGTAIPTFENGVRLFMGRQNFNKK